MAKKKKGGGGGDIPEWVVTYGDLMSLLLCFLHPHRCVQRDQRRT